MSDFIKLIIDGLVEGIDFIAASISMITLFIQMWSDATFGINTIPVLQIVPVSIAALVIKFILRRGK